jgi:hypothetical protein
MFHDLSFREIIMWEAYSLHVLSYVLKSKAAGWSKQIKFSAYLLGLSDA